MCCTCILVWWSPLSPRSTTINYVCPCIPSNHLAFFRYHLNEDAILSRCKILKGSNIKSKRLQRRQNMKIIKKTADLQDETVEWSATIHVGRNCVENDLLFFQAHQNDVWFHLDKGSSAHVYLHIDKGTLNKGALSQLMHECADLVRQHSKCNSNAKVASLPKRYLRKTPDCKPGEVILVRSPDLL